MDRLVKKFAQKLIKAGLAGISEPHQPLVGGLDDVLVWNRSGCEVVVLEKLFGELSINALVFFRPRPPYDRIIDFLSRDCRTIVPRDCETRTFLHELPVVPAFDPTAVIPVLKRSKGVIVNEGGQGPAVIAHGTVSPEQGFVIASSICFACFVKFFSDYLADLQQGCALPYAHAVFEAVAADLENDLPVQPALMQGPFTHEAQVFQAIAQAGRQTVDCHLVDSYFGNISYCWNDILYISQTGSSLDELKGCVDPVPLDGSTSAGLTASSELTAHLGILSSKECQAILHGHPKFSVILSMDCPPGERAGCPDRDRCHIQCPRPRQVADIPIVPGEVGTGPTGLCHTLPPALAKSRGAIVYGHGLFTTGQQDFNEAFQTLVQVEAMCQKHYLDKVAALRAH